MKYYSLKYTARIKGGWGGLASMWKIQILHKYQGDKGLLEHEKFHVRCWWYCLLITLVIAAAMYHIGTAGWWLPVALLAPWMHGTLYRNKYFRRWAEIRAYRIQLRKGSYPSPQFAVIALTTKYRLGMSDRAARKALGID